MKLSEKKRAKTACDLLEKKYPDAVCSLTYKTAYELLIATRLSAQCSDKTVNMVTPELFKRFPDPESLAAADVNEVASIIHICGLFKTKSESLVGIGKMLCEEFGGKVPDTIEQLIRLPGVGRKTANLVVGDIYGKPAVVADTHFIRLCNRLGFVSTENPEAVEREMRKLLPPERSNDFCHRMVLLGREICTARKALCNDCPLNEICYKHINIKPVKRSKGKGKK